MIWFQELGSSERASCGVREGGTLGCHEGGPINVDWLPHTGERGQLTKASY